MSNQKKNANRYLIRRCVLALLGVLGILGATTPAEANVVAARQALEARVLTMRAAIYDVAEASSATESFRMLAQWANWGNWNYWNNFSRPNWNNSWSNWFNR